MAALTAFAPGFGSTLAVLGKIAAAATPVTGTGRAAVRAAMAVLAARSGSFAKLSSSEGTLYPPLRPAAAARSGSFAKFPPLACPPVLAIFRYFSSSIDAKPRFDVCSRSGMVRLLDKDSLPADPSTRQLK